MRKSIAMIALGLALGLAGTGTFALASEDPTPTPTATSGPSPTSTATAAVTPTPTGTVAATATPAVASLKGTVVNVSADGVITVAVDGTTYTVTVGLSTVFEPSGTTLESLDPGDIVEFEGTLSGTVMVASKVELEGEDFDCDEEESTHGQCVSRAAHEASDEMEPGRERGQLVSCVARGEEECYIQVDDDLETDVDGRLNDASKGVREERGRGHGAVEMSNEVREDGGARLRDREMSRHEGEGRRGDGKERDKDRDDRD